jgi:hypothetical protein
MEKSSVTLALKLNGSVMEGRKIRVTKASEELAQMKNKPDSKKVIEGTRARKGEVKLRKPKTKGKKKA